MQIYSTKHATTGQHIYQNYVITMVIINMVATSKDCSQEAYILDYKPYMLNINN